MKLGACLVACDSNPIYLGFFPLILRAWEDIVGIDIHLVLVASQLADELRPFQPNVSLVQPVDGIPTAFQAQCIRLLYPALMAEITKDAVLISDMDVAPMNRRYFINPLEGIDDTCFVVYRSGLLEDTGELPVCYNAATPAVWGSVFPGLRDSKDIAQMLRDWWHENPVPYRVKASDNWATDQRQLYRHVERWSDGAGAGLVARLSDRDTCFRRLDRGRRRVNRHRRLPITPLLRGGYYSDFHMPPAATFADLNRRAIDAASESERLGDRWICRLGRLASR